MNTIETYVAIRSGVEIPSYATEAKDISDERVTAWHASGLLVRGHEPLTIEDVFTRVPEISSPVVRHDVVVNGDKAPGWFANVREFDNKVLGIVGGRYRIVQNRDAFDFGTDIIEQSGAVIDSVGVVNDGSIVWFALNLNHEVQIAGMDTEKLSTYLLISNGHDGKHAISASVVTLRLSCNNQLAWAIRDARRKYTVRHTSGLDGRLLEARKALGVSFRYTDTIAEIGERLIQQTITDGQIDEWLTKVMPIPEDPTDRQITLVENKRAAVRSTLNTAPDLADIKDTRWGFLQAVSDWENHQSRIRVTQSNAAGQARMARLLNGQQTASSRALSLLTA